MLVHLPDGHGAIAVRDGLLDTIQMLPEHLRKGLTRDQGTELAQHRQITPATEMASYSGDQYRLSLRCTSWRSRASASSLGSRGRWRCCSAASCA